MGITIRRFVPIFAIVSLGFLVYLNSLLNPFIWDDVFLIVNNLHIKDLGYIPRLFTETVYHQEMIGRYYRPVLMTSFALDYHFWGPGTFGYHLSNILIHLGNALLVYGIIRLIFRRELLAFLTAMLFVLHPVQAEAVTYISGRADPLAAFFCLLSLYFFITYLDFSGYRRKLYFGGSVLSFLLALLSKESAAIFPFILVFYEVCFRRKELKGKRFAKYAVYLFVLLAYGVIRHFTLLGVKNVAFTNDSCPLSSRLYTVPLIILTNLKLLLFPKQLHMERTEFLFDRPAYFFEPRVVLAVSALIAIAVFMWLIRKRSREAFFGFGWFIIFLLPVLNIVPINAFVAEHWLYLPSVGFFLAVSSAFAGLLRFRSIKLCIAGFIIIVLAILGILTIRQNYLWKNPIFFYKYTLKFSPTSITLLNNLGIEYFKLGLYKEAEEKYRQAIELKPVDLAATSSYINLGSALYWQGKKKEALEAYSESIKVSPNSSLGYWHLGNVLCSDGDIKKSIELYKKAVEFTPSNSYYWLSLGNAYLEEKAFGEAIEAYKKALLLLPYFFEARVNLGTAYYKQGMFKEAFGEYQKALKLNPENPEVYYYIGNICAAIGQIENAKEFWEETLRKNPAHAGARAKLEKLEMYLIKKSDPR